MLIGTERGDAMRQDREKEEDEENKAEDLETRSTRSNNVEVKRGGEISRRATPVVAVIDWARIPRQPRKLAIRPEWSDVISFSHMETRIEGR